MGEGSDISMLYREFADALTEVLAENAVGLARRGRLARARAAFKKHSQYAARLSVLPHCVTRQVSFVLQRQLAQSGKQFPGLKLELPQLPQTRKNQFGWPFHGSVYGRFSMPRCDVKHWPHRPARSESSEGDIEANALLFLRDITRIGVRCCVVSLARRRSRNTAIGFKFASFNGRALALCVSDEQVAN